MQKHQYQFQTFILMLVSFSLGCNEFMVVGITSNIARTFHVSLAQVGLLVSVYAITYVIMTPLLAMITSKYNRYYTLLILLAIFFITNVLTAIAPSISWLFGARILTACVVGIIISIVFVFVTAIAPFSKRGLLLSIVTAGYSVTSIIGIPIETALSDHFSWRMSFGVIAGLVFIVTPLLVAIFLPRKLPSIPQGNHQNQLSIFKDYRIILGSALIMLITTALYTFYTYIRPLIVTILHFDHTQLNWLLSVLGIFFIIGDIASGILANHHGFRFAPQMMSALVGMLVLIRLAYRFPWLCFICIGLFHFCFALPQASQQLLFLDIAHAKYPAAIDLISSLNPIFTNIGIALGSITASIALHFTPLKQLP